MRNTGGLHLLTKKGNNMKKAIALLGVLFFTLSAAGCNTVKGAGKDVERGGEKVQDAATNTQQKM
jgi:predicted small secreted protein